MPHSQNVNLARNVKIRLAALGLNLADVSRMVETTKTTISNRLKDPPSEATLHFWSAVLVAPVADIIDPDPTRIGSLPLPPDGWQKAALKGLKGKRQAIDLMIAAVEARR